MNKQFYINIFLVCVVAFQSCKTYKRSFGKTYTSTSNVDSSKIYRLNLSHQNLNENPVNLHQLEALKMLNLSGNKTLDLASFFQQIQHPEKLEILILDSLALKKLPKNIERFINLKHLSLNANPALDTDTIFSTIKTLPIQFLNLQHNNIELISNGIAQVSSLKSINVSHNKINTSETFLNLAKLPRLKSLWLNANQLQYLPEEIGKITTLRNLYIEHNQLLELPNAIKNLIQLNVFHIGHNYFETLPIQLINMQKLILLHVNNCKIKTISNEFTTSKFSVKGIILDNNKLSDTDKQKWKKEFRGFFLASF